MDSYADWMADFTPEVLVHQHRANPRGLIVFNDEQMWTQLFAGIATKMERYCGRLALGLEVMKYGCKESKLEENGNGLPEFDLDLVTAFLVKERISPRGMEARRECLPGGT